MLEFAIAFLSSLGTVPGILLALALAPRLTGRLAIVLAVIDLWLLLEVVEALVRPAYTFGSDALPRLMASALQVALAIAVFRGWERGGTSDAPAPIPLAQSRPLRRRPIRSHASSMSGTEAA